MQGHIITGTAFDFLSRRRAHIPFPPRGYGIWSARLPDKMVLAAVAQVDPTLSRKRPNQFMILRSATEGTPSRTDDLGAPLKQSFDPPR